MKEHNELICWVKEHKKELIIAGISIGALIIIILGLKNRKAIISLWNSMRTVVKEPTVKVSETVAKVSVDVAQKQVPEVVTAVASNSNNIPVEVSRHIRNLPQGWHASQEKVLEAMKNNIILMEGQTWVEGYTKGAVAA